LERVDERIAEAEKALKNLEEADAPTKPNAVERDAAVMRFVYTFQATWKTARLYLADREGIDVGTPKQRIREARKPRLLTDAEAERAMPIAEDHSVFVQAYREPLAVAIFARLPSHASVISAWPAAMRRRVQWTSARGSPPGRSATCPNRP
jgi:hypothetical protein